MFNVTSNILFCFLVLAGNIYAQFELKVSTNKDTYQYGEKIYITCTVTNISDTTVNILAGSYNTCQAEFELNSYFSEAWTICLETSQELVFQPNASREYSWTINPEIFGLPEQNGTQRIVGHFFYKDMTDTIYINAPEFLGGQLTVGFLKQNDDQLDGLRDSLNVEVVNRTDYPNTDNISETWQLYGHPLDSIYMALSGDDRLEWVEYNRSISYDSITVTSVNNESFSVNSYYLSNAYPNPFNPTTKIEYKIPQSGLVSIIVYDLLGREIATLVNEKKAAGNYEVEFDGSNLSSGVYLYQMVAGNFISTKKFIYLK